MKVIHIESGLGNQMLSYCEYLAIKKCNPNDSCYIETFIYDIPECNEVICQWNGYELQRIFGIEAPNIKYILTESQITAVLDYIRETHFWLKNWNYPVYFTEAFKSVGIELVNMRGNFEASGEPRKTSINVPSWQKGYWFLYLNFLRHKYVKKNAVQIKDYRKDLFISTSDNVFTGQKLLFKNKGSGIEEIEPLIRQTFIFPTITDNKNATAMSAIQSCNSVAIHARRGDMLGYNFDCYAGGYFKRSVSYIKNHVENPMFFIFCDEDSVDWVRNNSKVFNLNLKRDKVHFVDWNKKNESWRDMQLMAACKHQVITRSSFGWWGAWLNTNPNKITCSPDIRINTTHHF